MAPITGCELYEAAVLESLARHDASPPVRMTKDGELRERPRPKFSGFDLLPESVKRSWDAKAEQFNEVIATMEPS